MPHYICCYRNNNRRNGVFALILFLFFSLRIVVPFQKDERKFGYLK